MKTFFGMAIAILAVCSLAFAQQPAYQAKASAHDLMSKIVAPSNGVIGAMRKAGGPQTDEDWAASATAAALLAESGQLLQMGGRPKDQVWSDAAMGLANAASALLDASNSKNAEAWTAALGGIGQNCQSCHKVHRTR